MLQMLSVLRWIITANLRVQFLISIISALGDDPFLSRFPVNHEGNNFVDILSWRSTYLENMATVIK
jgi:hypothetical protein